MSRELLRTLSVYEKKTVIIDVARKYRPDGGVEIWDIPRQERVEDALRIANTSLAFYKEQSGGDEISARDVEIERYDWEKAVKEARSGEYHWLRLKLSHKAIFNLESAVKRQDWQEINTWVGLLILADDLPGGIIDDPLRPLPGD